MKSLFTNFEKLKATIKTTYPDWNEQKGLSYLDEKIKTISDRTSYLETLNLKLKEVKNSLLDLDQLVSYHLKLEKIARLEGELPQVQRRLDELNIRLQKLRDLEKALVDIKKSISKEQKNCIEKVIKEVQDSIKDYYNKILSHNYYSQLEIELEVNPEGAHTYWIKGRGEKDSTYVRTRFSEAQLNATALAIFLAMVKHSSHHLGLIIFDDPTQSMDKDHKEALAKLLCQEMEKKQIIIATQDEEFYRTLKKQIEYDTAKCFNMEDWSVKGPLLTIQNKARSFLGLFTF